MKVGTCQSVEQIQRGKENTVDANKNMSGRKIEMLQKLIEEGSQKLTSDE